MPGDPPARLIRCEVLASWRGLRLVPNRGRWDLVPAGYQEVVVNGRVERRSDPPEAAGLTLHEVEAYLDPERRAG